MLWWSAVVLHIRDQRMGPAGTIDRARAGRATTVWEPGLWEPGLAAMGSLRLARCTVLPASRASPLPQGNVAQVLWEPGLPAMGSLRFARCTVLPASRASPLPQGKVVQGLWEPGLPAMGSLRLARCTVLPASRASPLPQRKVVQGLWEPGLPAMGHCGWPDAPCCLHREQARSHRGMWCRGNAGAVVGQMA